MNTVLLYILAKYRYLDIRADQNHRTIFEHEFEGKINDFVIC